MLFTNPNNGQVFHLSPPKHHADPVPSTREINNAWLILTSTLTEKQFTALKPALHIIQRVLPITHN